MNLRNLIGRRLNASDCRTLGEALALIFDVIHERHPYDDGGEHVSAALGEADAELELARIHLERAIAALGRGEP